MVAEDTQKLIVQNGPDGWVVLQLNQQVLHERVQSVTSRRAFALRINGCINLLPGFLNIMLQQLLNAEADHLRDLKPGGHTQKVESFVFTQFLHQGNATIPETSDLILICKL
eukprot:Skav210426  [mRNA]  locus=scaffold1573:407774:408109:- [translate_table: standard]